MCNHLYRPLSERKRHCAGWFLCVWLAGLLGGCANLFQPTPTLTPTIRPFLVPTLDAPIPTPRPGGNIEDALSTAVMQFTPHMPVAVGTEGATQTWTPMATEASFGMSFFVPDGLRVMGTYYGAPRQPAPTVILLHDAGGARSAWAAFAAQLQAAGYNALALDLRGFGATGGTSDWRAAVDDVISIFARVRVLPGVDGARMNLIGAGEGGSVALGACAALEDCLAVALLSPVTRLDGLEVPTLAAAYGERPLFLAMSRFDQPSADDSLALRGLAAGTVRLMRYEGTAHGAALLAEQPELASLLIGWLRATVLPARPAPTATPEPTVPLLLIPTGTP